MLRYAKPVSVPKYATRLFGDHLAKQDLIELLPTERMETPLAYWLIVGPRSGQRPEVQAFSEWLVSQAAITAEAMGEKTIEK